MPRQSRSSRPTTSRSSSSSSAPAGSRSASTAAHPQAGAGAHPQQGAGAYGQQTQQRQPGMLANMASTMGGAMVSNPIRNRSCPLETRAGLARANAYARSSPCLSIPPIIAPSSSPSSFRPSSLLSYWTLLDPLPTHPIYPSPQPDLTTHTGRLRRRSRYLQHALWRIQPRSSTTSTRLTRSGGSE